MTDTSSPVGQPVKNGESGFTTREAWISLVLVLVVAVISIWILAWYSETLRRNEYPASAASQIADDYTKAIDLAQKMLALAVSLAGFFGIAAGASSALRGQQDAAASAAGAGLAGVLAGASIMGLGGWAAPAALVALLVGRNGFNLIKIGRAP